MGYFQCKAVIAWQFSEQLVVDSLGEPPPPSTALFGSLTCPGHSRCDQITTRARDKPRICLSVGFSVIQDCDVPCGSRFRCNKNMDGLTKQQWKSDLGNLKPFFYSCCNTLNKMVWSRLKYKKWSFSASSTQLF